MQSYFQVITEGLQICYKLLSFYLPFILNKNVQNIARFYKWIINFKLFQRLFNISFYFIVLLRSQNVFILYQFHQYRFGFLD